MEIFTPLEITDPIFDDYLEPAIMDPKNRTRKKGNNVL